MEGRDWAVEENEEGEAEVVWGMGEMESDSLAKRDGSPNPSTGEPEIEGGTERSSVFRRFLPRGRENPSPNTFLGCWEAREEETDEEEEGGEEGNSGSWGGKTSTSETVGIRI